MENNFLTVLHEVEVFDDVSLDMLKGGVNGNGCTLHQCGCYKTISNGSCGGKNTSNPTPMPNPQPEPSPTPTDSITHN